MIIKILKCLKIFKRLEKNVFNDFQLHKIIYKNLNTLRDNKCLF